jgi:hypothetical protein
MADPFASPKLSLYRAQHHINDLKLQIANFTDEKPWSYVVEKDSETGQYVHKVVFTRRMPINLPSILFDAVSNLRAALDQCAYATAIAANTPLNHIKFPFASDQSHWVNSVAGGCKDLPAEIQALFRRCNAYKGGNNALWALNQMCNTQKHFALIPFELGSAMIAIGKEEPIKETINPEPGIAKRFKIKATVTFAGGAMARSNPSWDSIKNEIVLLKSADGGVGLNHQPTVTINIAIDGIDILSRKPAIAVLNAIGDEVRSISMATEAECRRVGFIR